MRITHLIKELCGETAAIQEDLGIELGNDVTIYATDDTGFEQPIAAVEIWEGELRVLVWPENKTGGEEPIIVPIRRVI